MTSKTLLIDFEKPGQHTYAMFIPQMAHSDEQIKKVQEYIHDYPNSVIHRSILVFPAKFNIPFFFPTINSSTEMCSK